MKKAAQILLIFTLMLLILLSFSLSAFAETQAASEYEYYVDWDNQAVLTKYLGTEATVTVPAIIDGYSVKSTEGTFANNEQIKKVVFSYGIISIDYNTFLNCTSLREVKLPDSVESLGDYAFSNTALTSVYLSKNTSYIGTGCFYESKDLKFAKAEAESLYIGQLAFYDSGIELMQLSAEPKYWDNSFSGVCKFSYNSITTFAMQHEPLYSILYFAANQPIVIRALYATFFALFFALIVIAFIYVLYRAFRRIRIVLGKDKLTLYKTYNKKCMNSVELSDNSVSLIYKKKTFFSDKAISFCVLIIFPVVYISGFLVIAFFVLGLFNGFLKTLSLLWILTRLIFLIVLLILYVVLTYLFVKIIVATVEAMGQRNFGQATRSSARIKKVRKG